MILNDGTILYHGSYTQVSEPENLKDQICIRTAKALRCLSFIECQEVTI